jgi:spore germination protein YaaH
MQKKTIYLSALFFIISCGHLAGQSFIKRDTIKVFTEIEKLKTNDFSTNLLKRLGNVFKFRKFTRVNENNRVIDLLNQLNIGDSIVATQQNVAFLNKYLGDTVNQNIDSLYSLIGFLQRNNQDLSNGIESVNSAQGVVEKRKDLPDKYNEDYKKIGQDKYANRMVTDKELNILASKIFPIISVSSDIKKITQKMSWLNMLKNIRDPSGILREAVDTVTGNKKYFSIRTKNKIEIYGFYNYFTKDFGQTENLGYINTLIYSSLYINSKTGDIKDLNGWDTSAMVRLAQNAGCSVALTFAIESAENVHYFLTNGNALSNFIKTAVYLMKFRNAGMINISFGNLNFEDEDKFTGFITTLNKRLKQDNNDYKLLLTVPGIAAGNYYDLPQLAGITDRIIIDFSHNYSLTASPLAALPALKETISFFIKSKVLPETIVVCLPYHGVKWAKSAFYPDKFIEYINYTTLRKNHLFPGYINYLDETYVTSVMDSIGLKKDTLRRIYYDDESTLGFKYDFILKSGFKGVAVNAMGEDNGYQGLWDEMSYAFAMPDTIHINSPKQIKNETGPSFVRKYSILLMFALALLLLLIFYIIRRRKNYS